MPRHEVLLESSKNYFTQVYLPLVRTPMIEPTKVYKDMKAWTPEEAADAILGAIVSQDSTVSLAMGKVAELCSTLPYPTVRSRL